MKNQKGKEEKKRRRREEEEKVLAFYLRAFFSSYVHWNLSFSILCLFYPSVSSEGKQAEKDRARAFDSFPINYPPTFDTNAFLFNIFFLSDYFLVCSAFLHSVTKRILRIDYEELVL